MIWVFVKVQIAHQSVDKQHRSGISIFEQCREWSHFVSKQEVAHFRWIRCWNLAFVINIRPVKTHRLKRDVAVALKVCKGIEQSCFRIDYHLAQTAQLVFLEEFECNTIKATSTRQKFHIISASLADSQFITKCSVIVDFIHIECQLCTIFKAYTFHNHTGWLYIVRNGRLLKQDSEAINTFHQAVAAESESSICHLWCPVAAEVLHWQRRRNAYWVNQTGYISCLFRNAIRLPCLTISHLKDRCWRVSHRIAYSQVLVGWSVGLTTGFRLVADTVCPQWSCFSRSVQIRHFRKRRTSERRHYIALIFCVSPLKEKTHLVIPWAFRCSFALRND